MGRAAGGQAARRADAGRHGASGRVRGAQAAGERGSSRQEQRWRAGGHPGRAVGAAEGRGARGRGTQGVRPGRGACGLGARAGLGCALGALGLFFGPVRLGIFLESNFWTLFVNLVHEHCSSQNFPNFFFIKLNKNKIK